MQTTKPTTTPTTTQLNATFVSVNLENSPGQLGRCARVLADASINVEAFNCSEGGFQFLVNNPTKAVEVLEGAEFKAETVDLFAVRLPNTPGAIATLGEQLGREGVNIETCFGVGGTRENGRIFVTVDDPQKARPILERIATSGVPGRTTN